MPLNRTWFKTSLEIVALTFMKRNKHQRRSVPEGNPSNAKDPAKTVDAAEAEKNAQPARDREQAANFPNGEIKKGKSRKPA